MEGRESRAEGRWIRTALAGLGAGLLVVTLGEMAFWFGVVGLLEPTFIAGIAMSIPACLALLFGSYRLPETVVTPEYYPRIALLTVGGGAVFGLFSFLTGVTFLPSVIWALVGSVRWGLSLGTGIGFVVGFLNARSIERALAAERSSIRAEATEQQREYLTYVNGLLRHEVLNTANVISGNVDLARETASDEVKGRLDTIERQAAELSTVIEDVRFLTDVVRNERVLEPVELRPVLERELRQLTDRHDGVETELDISGDVVVLADPLLRRVFANLFENGVRHNDSETKHVAVSVSQVDDTVRVDITDNGEGVPERLHDDLFSLDVREHTTHGLGLKIVARLLDRYDGDVTLTETGGAGTTVTVILQRATSETDAATDGSRAAQAGSSVGTQLFGGVSRDSTDAQRGHP